MHVPQSKEILIGVSGPVVNLVTFTQANSPLTKSALDTSGQWSVFL